MGQAVAPCEHHPFAGCRNIHIPVAAISHTPPFRDNQRQAFIDGILRFLEQLALMGRGVKMQRIKNIAVTANRVIGRDIDILAPAWRADNNEIIRINLSDRANERFSIRFNGCLLYTSPSPRDKRQSRMPSSA